MKFPTRTQDSEQLMIVKSGLEYTLPVGWSISGSGTYDFRNELQERAYAHGSDMVGDGKINGRTLEIEFEMKGDSEADHDEVLNQAYTYFTMTDYNLHAGRGDRVYRVAGPSKITHNFRDGFKQRRSTVTVSLFLSDPFRYEAQESKVTYTFEKSANQAEIILHNLGSVDTPLTFRFIPTGNMGTVTMWHQEEEEKFTLSDALLISPATAIVNGKEGTVWRDNANSINTFSGQFLRADPGSNLYLYTGGAATIEITYTNRWYI